MTELQDAFDKLREAYNDLEHKLHEAQTGRKTYTMEEVFDDVRRDEGLKLGTHCRCGDEATYGECLLHPIKHYHRPDCCPEPEERHRIMTEGEFEREFPLIFDRTFGADAKRYRVYARRYWSGVGVTLTTLYPGEEDVGLCYDFPGAALEGFADALKELLTTDEFSGSRN